MEIVKIAVKMDNADNVAVMMEDISAGEQLQIEGQSLTARERIPRGHKIAVLEIEEGKSIIKYGVPVGKSKCKIMVGQHVHCHNVKDITAEINSLTAMDKLRKKEGI